MTRVLVCGGRDCEKQKEVFAVLDRYHAERPFSVVIHGAARGADTLAGQWAAARGVPVEEYPADWQRLGNGAGPARNARMLRDGRPEVVVAFPGRRGTHDMTERATRARVPVVRITEYDLAQFS